MTYTPNIPKAPDDPSQSQPLILSNFQQLNIQYGTSGDHVPFTASSSNGTHKKVTWINQSASIPVSGPQQVVAYSNTQSGITMPYYQRDTLPTIYPLSPIKAYATFLTILSATGDVILLDSFNITNINHELAADAFYTVNFTNVMRTTNYGIVATVGIPSSAVVGPGYTNLTTANFRLTFPILAAARYITLMVLET